MLKLEEAVQGLSDEGDVELLAKCWLSTVGAGLKVWFETWCTWRSNQNHHSTYSKANLLLMQFLKVLASAGGAAIGAAIGTIIFPGIGTAIGAFIGGEMGSIPEVVEGFKQALGAQLA